MKGIFVIGVAVLVVFVLTTSPVIKRWTRSHLAPMSAIRDVASALSFSSDTPAISFKCDGRKYCSQMTSCAEATSFLTYCPGTEMDGDHDGIPCESQWCK